MSDAKKRYTAQLYADNNFGINFDPEVFHATSMKDAVDNQIREWSYNALRKAGITKARLKVLGEGEPPHDELIDWTKS